MADSTGTIILLGGAGLAFYGYTQGWFDSFLKPAAAVVVPPAGPTPVPALGTTVTSAADVLRQVAANDAYIIPDAATFTQTQSAIPAGYGWVITTDRGGVLLRPDVYSAVNALIRNRANRATSQGASAASIQAAGQTNLAEIQQTMSNSGLTGLGDFRRHMMTRTGRLIPYRAGY